MYENKKTNETKQDRIEKIYIFHLRSINNKYKYIMNVISWTSDVNTKKMGHIR